MQIDPILPFVLPEVPGCPDPLARAHVLLAAMQFCRESRAWNEFQDPITLQAGVSEYDLDTPSDGITLSILGVWIGPLELKPVSMHQLQDKLPQWRTLQGNEPVFYNAAQDFGSISVYPTPNASGMQMLVQAYYQPKITSTTLPDFIGDRYLEAIAAGAKARLMTMPGVPWSNNGLAAVYKQAFDDAVSAARIEQDHGRTPGTLTVRPRAFGF